MLSEKNASAPFSSSSKSILSTTNHQPGAVSKTFWPSEQQITKRHKGAAPDNLEAFMQKICSWPSKKRLVMQHAPLIALPNSLPKLSQADVSYIWMTWHGMAWHVASEKNHPGFMLAKTEKMCKCQQKREVLDLPNILNWGEFYGCWTYPPEIRVL